MFVEGRGFTVPQDNNITNWVDLRADINIYTRQNESDFSISGIGFSEFQNKEYYTLFNTRKTVNNKYVLIKTLYKYNSQNEVKEQGVIIYKIITYDLSTLRFELKGFTEIHGEIKGELVFKQKEGYRL